MNEEDALKAADALHEFVAAAPHDYPGHNIALFESAEAAIRSLVADSSVWRSPAASPQADIVERLRQHQFSHVDAVRLMDTAAMVIIGLRRKVHRLENSSGTAARNRREVEAGGAPSTASQRVEAPHTWPAGCHDPDSCMRHKCCMYSGCRHLHTDAKLLEAEMTTSSVTSPYRQGD